ncbi:mannosylglycoprotein endo-beta-mannosidase, partial [Tanacetum coccineum]
MGEEKGKKVLEQGWIAARSTDVELTGIQLTTTHPPPSSSPHWMPAVIPGTYALLIYSSSTIFI